MSKYNVQLPSISQGASPRMMWFKIDGSALTTTSSSAGLLSGIRAADAADATNVVTVTFKEGLESVPLGAAFHPEATATQIIARNVTLAKTSVAYTTVDASDNSAASDVDGLLVVFYLEGVDII